jgi:dephospho-CoA kinase
LVRRYGKSILNGRGRIDRVKLAATLFTSKKEKAWLEGKIHPEVRRIVGQRIQKARKRNPPLILVEAALHVETGYGRSFEGMIVVESNPAQQIQRLVARDALSAAEGRRRLKNQVSPRRRLRHADWVIDNSGTVARTRSQVRKLFKELTVLK